MTFEMNDQPLPLAYGAPLRLRVKRQLGDGMAEYIVRIKVTGSLETIGADKGGFILEGPRLRNVSWNPRTAIKF